MFNLEITVEQKRWGYIPDPDMEAEFHSRTVVTEMSIEDNTGLQGSVAVQKEMMFSAFPPGLTLEFKNGVLQELYRNSIKPYSMEKTVGLGSEASAVFTALNDTTQAEEGAGDGFTRPCLVTLSNFTETGFDWAAIITGGASISGSVTAAPEEYPVNILLYEDSIDSTGITLSVDQYPGEIADVTTTFTPASKININGVWIPESFEDEGDTHGFDVAFEGTNVVFTFIGGYTLTIPQSLFISGSWYELPDPTDPATLLEDKRKSGISVRFGFTEDESVDFSADPDPVFYGQLLSSEDSITDFEDTFLYRRVMDITDLRGSLGRYDDLSLFYRSRRWIKEVSGVPRFYYLKPTEEDPDVYEWALFTGTVLTSNEPDLRAASAKTVFSSVERADEEATALINMIRIFKSQYVDFVNASFSTDTDEYPDKKQVIVI